MDKMPIYQIELDGGKATAEQRAMYSPMSATLQIKFYTILKDLGYNVKDTVWGYPLEVEPPIVGEHRKIIEVYIDAPFVISEVQPQ